MFPFTLETISNSPRNKNSGHGKAKPGIWKSMTYGDCTKINFSLSLPDDALSDLQ